MTLEEHWGHGEAPRHTRMDGIFLTDKIYYMSLENAQELGI